MNEQERELREKWASFANGAVVSWMDIIEEVRAFCESEPSAPAVVEPEALRKVREDHRFACKELERAANARDEAQREAEAMRALANKNANELNAAVKERDEFKRHHESMQCALHNLRCHSDAAQRSYSTQLAELTRALEAEKRAHSEALRPYEYTRAAVKYAEESTRAYLDPNANYDREHWEKFRKLYTARQRGEPSAPVSSQPPARVLETWAAQYADGVIVVGFESEKGALQTTGVVRAYRVALPVIETVERGA